ncbi:hypothetical protein KZZ07_05995 [Mameliella sp. CS4]|mgnify:FL=1|uniref:DUF1998 domain-containing protein n=1 Tax=Mameliella sp. CS4 TaxID=2862329 RepID=UPI001C605304|nr:DUF1998 domain-containing protein [Mameliella sp. CS4]MBW4982091.1 hypothetical protein [Mameliella sp. CS4]
MDPTHFIATRALPRGPKNDPRTIKAFYAAHDHWPGGIGLARQWRHLAQAVRHLSGIWHRRAQRVDQCT